jgi:oligopeptide/dipeptide ABC transporter ATP-binding protein
VDPLLDIRNLSIDFRTPRGDVKAVRDVSFRVPAGRIVGVVGESGSGKSTVLWSILGLLSSNARIVDGEIRFNDRDILHLGDTARRALRGEQISVVFQDPMTCQIPVLPYGRQMLDILYRRPTLPVAEKRRLAVEMMGKVGIPDPATRIDQYPHHFSGGMRQRAGIAMALLTGPALLLADEPTTALDVTMEAQIIHLLRELQRELHATVVVVSHNLGLIAELCDEVVVMYAGVVVESGSVHDIFHRSRHPYTRALLECDPARIAERSRKLPVIPGDVPDLTSPPPGCVFAPRCPRVMEICHGTVPPTVPAGGGGIALCHLLAGPMRDPSWPPPANVPTVGADEATATPPRTEHVAFEPILEVAGLSVRFRTMGALRARLRRVARPYVDAVLDVSFSVRPGETLALVGESGSGKTTLGLTILNMVAARAGTVRFEGQQVRDMPERRFKPLRRDMAMMFQDPVGSLSPRKSVRALITEPFQIHGLGDRDLDDEAERLCDLVRLPRAFLSRYPHELSGGQARRVGVARALALRPKLIAADEPTAGLDVSVQGEILNLMADLQREHRLAYLIVTHNLPVVRHISDRLAIMYLGRIVEQGNSEEIFRSPAHPYTEALVRGVPQPDPDRRRRHVSISGEVPSLLRRPAGCDFHTRCPYAQSRCRTEEPESVPLSETRHVRCHFPLSGG